MPLIIQGKSYPLPKESGQPSISGRELMTIEANFGLDALALLGSIGSDDDTRPGYTKAKGMYALTWVALHRDDDAWTVDRVIDEVPLDSLDFREEENPTDATS